MSGVEQWDETGIGFYSGLVVAAISVTPLWVWVALCLFR